MAGERLEGLPPLIIVSVPVIGPADPTDNVPKANLSNIRSNAGPAHERPPGSAEIVQRPGAYAGRLVKRRLELREAAERTIASSKDETPCPRNAL